MDGSLKKGGIQSGFDHKGGSKSAPIDYDLLQSLEVLTSEALP